MFQKPDVHQFESAFNRGITGQSNKTATRDRQACLIFASGVQHARHIVEVFGQRHGLECGLLTGETPSQERSELIDRFRGDPSGRLFTAEPLKYLCGVNAISTGLDVPRIDALALLRTTMSPGLYCQMVGRAFRLHPGKSDALILDFAGTRSCPVSGDREHLPKWCRPWPDIRRWN